MAGNCFAKSARLENKLVALFVRYRKLVFRSLLQSKIQSVRVVISFSVAERQERMPIARAVEILIAVVFSLKQILLNVKLEALAHMGFVISASLF